MDCHEVGRSISSLMSNDRFHNNAYGIESKDELLKAINDFLDESLVLPPGDWASSKLLSIQEITGLLWAYQPQHCDRIGQKKVH